MCVCLSLASTKVPEMYDKSPPAVKMHPRRCSGVDFDGVMVDRMHRDHAAGLIGAGAC